MSTELQERRARMERLARRVGFGATLDRARFNFHARRALAWYCPDDCWDL